MFTHKDREAVDEISKNESHRNSIIHCVLEENEFDKNETGIFVLVIVKIVKSIKSMNKWRNSKEYKNILENEEIKKDYEEVRKYMLIKLHKSDKESHPLVIMNTGKTNIHLLFKLFSFEQLYHYYYYEYELIMKNVYEVMKEKNFDYLNMSILLDMEGMTLKTHFSPIAMKFLQEFIFQYNNYFCGYVYRIYIVNTGKCFEYMWKLISNMIDNVNKKKIIITKNNKELLNYFDENDLPMKYGGKCSCKDGCIPIPISIDKIVNDDTYHFTLKPGEVKEISINVKKNDCVRYRIILENYDIKFSIFQRYEDGNEKELVESTKIQSQIQPFEGSVFIDENCECISVIDNSYSFWHSKSIYFDYYNHCVEDN